MSLTDSTYYVLDCNIPEGTYNTISEHITRYEGEILRQLLGYDLAKLVLAYDSETSPQRIIDLVEGKEYTIGDYTVKWNGLLNSDKVSLLAYYVYIQYLRNYHETFQNVGIVVSTVENSQVITPGGKIQAAGARLRELAGYQCQDSYYPSLRNFLLNHESDYPEWLWNEYKVENLFNL